MSDEEELRILITRNSVFLGDPATPNPWKKASQKTVESIGLSVEGGVVGAKTVVQIHARYVSRTLYAVKPDNDTLRIALKGLPHTSHSYGFKKGSWLYSCRCLSSRCENC